MVERGLGVLACSLLGAGLAACGGTTGSPPPLPDAGVVEQPDAQVDFCVDIEALYGDLGSVTGVASVGPTDVDLPDGAQVLTLQIPLNEDAEPDVLFLELWGDSPPFDEGFAPQSVTLNGDQSDLILCGACAYIAANYQEGGLIDFNMAYSGQLELSAVDPTVDTGRVTGSLSNLKMHEVTISQEAGQQTVPNGCLSELEAISFDFTVEAAPAP